MDFFLKILAYVVFVLGSLYFFFGKTDFVDKQRRKHTGIIICISILLLSYYYWFPN